MFLLDKGLCLEFREDNSGRLGKPKPHYQGKLLALLGLLSFSYLFFKWCSKEFLLRISAQASDLLLFLSHYNSDRLGSLCK